MRSLLHFACALLPLTSPAQYLINNFDGNMGWEELPIVIDTSATNIWQVGVPQKPVFQSAFSPVNVIVTDTIAPYPAGNVSRFTALLPTWGWGWWPEFFIHFQQKVDMDSAHAGGYIEISYDTGQTWMNVFEDWVNPPVVQLLDENWNSVEPAELSNGQLGFTGTSSSPPQWIWSSFCWVQTGIPLPDTVRMRFTFYSDTLAAPHDGWMLDDFEYQVYIAHPISEYLKMDRFFVTAPNPMSDRLFISYDTDGPSTPVRIELFDQQGRLVRIVRDAVQPEGRHNLILWRRDLPEALTVAFLKASIGDRSYTEKVLLAR